jgi:hypothetical protein
LKFPTMPTIQIVGFSISNFNASQPIGKPM